MRDPIVESEPQPKPDAPPDAKWSTRDLWILALVSAVAAIVRLVAIEQWSFDPVEVATLRALTQPLSAGDDGFTANDVSMYPVAFLLLRWLLEHGVLPGYTEGWLRLPFAFVGTLAVPLLALFARPRLGRAAAGVAALLLAVHPAHVAACQTASPVVMAVTAAIAAGVISRERANVWSWLLVGAAGLLHPIGWLLGLGMVSAAAPATGLLRFGAHLPRPVLLALALPALLLAFDVLGVVRIPVVVLAAFAVAVRPAIARLMALAAVPLLAFGGLLWLCALPGAGSAVGAIVPIATLGAAAGCVHGYGLLRRSLQNAGRLASLVGAAPAIIVVGESATALFLYFVVFQGGRAPWRDLSRAAFAAMRAGGELHVVAQSGHDVLRGYLRPSHWRDPAQDRHPGRVVEALDVDRIDAQLQDPFVLLALTGDEWRALREGAASAELLAQFRLLRLVPCEQPDGDATLYLLQRPPHD